MVRWFIFAVLATVADAMFNAREATRDVWQDVGRGGDDYSLNCQPFPGKRVVVVTVNHEYLDMFQNWLHHASQFLRGSEQLVTVAEDREAGIALRKLSTKLTPQFVVMDEFYDEHRHGNFLQLESRSAHPFMTQEFYTVVRQRPNRILTFLRQGCSTLYADIDSAWRSNPFREIDAAGIKDLYVTDDDVDNDGTSLRKFPEWNICTCFIYVHPKPETINLMEKWSSIMSESDKLVNQPAFNTALKEYSDAKTVDFALLPFEKFPPGVRGADFGAVSVFHANWRVGHDNKINFLQDRGMWVVPPNPVY